MTENRRVFFSAYTKPPLDSYITNMHIGVTVLIDTLTDKIIEGDCTLVPELSRKFIANLLQGQSLKSSPDKIIDELTYTFQDHHCRAITLAIHIIYDKYVAYKKHKDALISIPSA